LAILQDIFPTISGIDERVQKVTGFRYLAGLWLGHLHSDLLWYLDSIGKELHKWTAPSWPWASLQGPVQMMYSKNSTEYNGPFRVNIIDTFTFDQC
jgi:hypothetical protein